MGQYYYGVIINKENKHPIMASYCGKLLESNRADLASFVYELSRGRSGYRQQVVWAGDYSDVTDAEGNNLYDLVNTREEDGNKLPTTLQDLQDQMESRDGLSEDEREAAWQRNAERRKEYFLSNICTEEDTFKPALRYLCNHDRREYLDLNTFPYAGREYGCNNPLAVLCSDPTCRIKGGGDYFWQEDFQYYGAWSGCEISAEPEAPEGYKDIRTTFACDTEIWCSESICELIHGDRYADNVPAPNAKTFGRMFFRYDDEHIKLACVSREVILQMYADWQKRIDTERVYKAHDLLKRALKKDPALEHEYKGLTIEERKWTARDGSEYTDHYAVVDGVEFWLSKYNGAWDMLQAKLDGIEYDCDPKSRRYFRQLAKEHQAAAA